MNKINTCISIGHNVPSYSIPFHFGYKEIVSVVLLLVSFTFG